MPVKPSHIKKMGRKIIKLHKDKVTDDFEHNKELVDAVTNIDSKTDRNRIAGYITRKISDYKDRPEEEK